MNFDPSRPHTHKTKPKKKNQNLPSDFSLTLHPGENLGVTGPSGCGKSSLALLLTRMYGVQGGRILLDGYDVTELDNTFLRTTVRSWVDGWMGWMDDVDGVD
jgi:ABC-type multidrug transport system fused ATPase/permease subunit